MEINLHQFKVTLDLHGTLSKPGPPEKQYTGLDLTLETLCISCKSPNIPLLRVPHFQIQTTQRCDNGTGVILVLKTHDMWRFIFDSTLNCQRAHERILQLCSASQDSSLMLAYTFEMEELDNISETEGWKLFDSEQYVSRWQLSGKWKISNVNAEFNLSESLPLHLIVPSVATDQLLRSVSSFRAFGRLPHLVYFYPKTQAFIARSSQPLIGPKGKRSVDDEEFLRLLFSNRPSGGSPLPCIVDARTKSNSSNSKSRGGGSEADGSYVGIRTFFTTIETPAGLKEYYDRFLEVVRNNDCSHSTYLSESSGWFRQIQGCLRPATFIAKAVAIDGAPVLVHCDDGLDSTCILVSLSKLLIDPFYRTYKGFMMLIEEDWIQAGFRFGDRCGTSSKTSTSLEITPNTSTSPTIPNFMASLQPSSMTGTNSPLFLLFLDCVHQIWMQFTNEFEFNLEFLAMLHQQTSSNQFGTFLGNSPREYLDLKQNTISAWSYFNSEYKTHFINGFYRPVSQGILSISADSKAIRFWSGMYDPFNELSAMKNWNRVKFRADISGPCILSHGKIADVSISRSEKQSAVFRIREELEKLNSEDRKLVDAVNEITLVETVSVVDSVVTDILTVVPEKSWDPLNVQRSQ